MAITPEIEAEVLRIYRANPKRFSPSKTSRAVGCGTGDVNEIVRRNRHTITDGVEHNSGAGREDLQHLIVASRRVSERGWNNDDQAIVDARAAFCAGTHTMATHRDGAWLHLCLIPLMRQRPARPNYFKLGAA